MKYIFSVIAFLFLNIGFAQEMQIPFRVGEKFGLSDKNGHLKVPAIFSQGASVRDGFFSKKNHNGRQPQEKFIGFDERTISYRLIDPSQPRPSKPKFSIDDYPAPEVDNLTGGSSSPEFKKRRTSFRIKNDSTIFFGKNKIEHRAGTTYQTIWNNQKHPLIYHWNGKRGIIISEKNRTEAVYDSLFYVKSAGNFGEEDDEYFFIAGIKKENGQMIFTILDEFGKNYISEEFDRIHNFIPEIGIKYDYDKDDNVLRKITIQSEEKYFSPNRKSFVLWTDFIFGFKNGKRFLINLKTKEVTPVEYDALYKNAFGNFFPKPADNKFFIFEKDGKYGFSKMMNAEVDFVFEKIPFSFFPNYHQEKGFNLVALMDKNGFFCFAREDGFLFYQE